MEGMLFCSAGRRVSLLRDARMSYNNKIKLVATDNSEYAPALYMADTYYLVPKIIEENYLSEILDICKKNNIKAITTLIDPEIPILAKQIECFRKEGIVPLFPNEKTALLCLDKYEMYKYLTDYNIETIKTFKNPKEFLDNVNEEDFFPVFVKPREGSGSVGARKITNYEEIKTLNDDFIIQEFNDGLDCSADIYVDAITHELVDVFMMRKMSTTLGGANKVVSFYDENLKNFIADIVKHFEFSGPVNMDFFYKDGKYSLLEINPRFGGSYIYAYELGIDFFKYIMNNIEGKNNTPALTCNYDENVVMMMYDAIIKKSNLSK